MEELAAKKLGEAVALCGLGAEMMKEYESVLNQVMDSNELEKKRRIFEDHTKRSQDLGEELDESETVSETADKAREKFTTMRDAFLEGKTDDPLKLTSWLAISSAGGITIWAVLLGLSEAMDNDDLRTLSEEALDFQRQNLEEAEEALQELAKNEA